MRCQRASCRPPPPGAQVQTTLEPPAQFHDAGFQRCHASTPLSRRPAGSWEPGPLQAWACFNQCGCCARRPLAACTTGGSTCLPGPNVTIRVTKPQGLKLPHTPAGMRHDTEGTGTHIQVAAVPNPAACCPNFSHVGVGRAPSAWGQAHHAAPAAARPGCPTCLWSLLHAPDALRTVA